MPKIMATIFLLSIFGGLFLPLFSYAQIQKTYEINFCKFQDTNTNNEFDSGESWTVPPDCTKSNAEFSGFVLCGKCVGITDINGLVMDRSTYLTSRAEQRSLDRCGEAQSQIYIDCQLCHIFTTITQVVGFVLTVIVPPLAVLMLVIGGVMFYLGGAKPDMITRGRKLIVSVVIGLALIYGAYMIIGFLLTVIGAANIEAIGSVFKNGLFSIDCPIVLPRKF